MGSELTITKDQEVFTDSQVAALQQLGVRNASQGDLEVFFHVAQRSGLDPFAKQIYMIERQGKQTIQTGIDGFRLIANRSARAAGEVFGEPETLWCGPDGVWHDVWLNPNNPPAAAKVVVQKNGGTFSAVALFNEYAGRKRDGTVNSMWSSKPSIMLAKCAEALALRKAFPQDLSGIYSTEEMQSAEVVDAQVTTDHQPAVNPSPSKEDCAQIIMLMQQGGVHDAASAAVAFKALVGREITNPVQLTPLEAEQLLSSEGMLLQRVQQAVAAAPPVDGASAVSASVVSRTKAALEAPNA